MCPAGFTEKGDYCFKLETERKTWQQAVDACQEINSYLIEPRTEEINNIAKSFNLLNRPWIGASDISVEGNWVWDSDDETLTYTNWRRPEPNNGGIFGPQNCATFYSDGSWDDVGCTGRQQYICQTKKRTSLLFIIN